MPRLPEKKKALASKASVAEDIGGVTRMDAPLECMHGMLGDPDWAPPRLVVNCSAVARPGYAKVAAHEFLDDPDVLEAKCQKVANMIQRAANMLAYTGAGISTASGIKDYATKAGSSSVTKQNVQYVPPLEAQPSDAHRVLTSLYVKGHLKHWIQQNHDGLPQKAGFPQEAINEIHGAWFDPSNPVVKFSGTLRGDLFEWMYEWEEKADLVMVLGTSLSGMNADRVAISPGERAQRQLRRGADPNEVLGSIIVNIQRTKHDDISSIRIYAPIDKVMNRIAAIIGVKKTTGLYKPPHVSTSSLTTDVFTVPYNKAGQKLKNNKDKMMRLDLRKGQKVIVTQGSPKGLIGEVLGKTQAGHYRIAFADKDSRERIVRLLGLWWMEAAVTGSVDTIPVVNK